MSKIIASAGLFLTFFFLGISEASACKCAGRAQGDKNYQPCLAFWTADSVFIGLAEKISIENGQMKVSFLVEKAIRGVDGQRVKIVTKENAGVCGYPFKEGERYFVYARRDQAGKLTEGLCGPTTPLAKAENDLEYLKDIESGKSGKRLSGYVRENRREGYQSGEAFVPLAGIEITIKGRKNTFKTQTDESGFYLFKDMPPDAYRVTAKLPNGLREIAYREDLLDHSAVVQADGYSCGSENFLVTRQGSIRGRVVDFPVKDIKNPWDPDSPQPKVSLLPLDENGNVVPHRVLEEKWAYRDKYEFYFNAVPTGKYLLAINPNNCPYPNNGIPPMFFPGVADKSLAKIITVSEGEQLVLEDFRSLPILKERWFSGEAVYADKTPAAKVTVRLTDENINKCAIFILRSRQMKRGGSQLKGMETYEYRIDAFTERKNGQKQLYAKPFIIMKEGNSTNIQLILDVTL